MRRGTFHSEIERIEELELSIDLYDEVPRPLVRWTTTDQIPKTVRRSRLKVNLLKRLH